MQADMDFHKFALPWSVFQNPLKVEHNPIIANEVDSRLHIGKKI